jgi:hypothetical protein
LPTHPIARHLIKKVVGGPERYMETEVRAEKLTLSRTAENESFVTLVKIRRVASFDDLIVTLSILGLKFKLTFLIY